MGSPLGSFSIGLHGRVTTLKASYDAHAALTTGVHGAVSTATVNRLMIRDANGRVNVVAPAASNNSTLVPTTAWVLTEIGASGGGTVTSVSGGVGLSGTVTTSGSINMANTSVSAGSYTLASITVDAQGRLTAASNGAAVTSITATAPLVKTGTASVPVLSMPAATASVNGYATSTQITKLNGIATGAQVNAVTTVFTRTGAVVATAGDYTVQQITGITVSDSGPSGGSNGDVWLEY